MIHNINLNIKSHIDKSIHYRCLVDQLHLKKIIFIFIFSFIKFRYFKKLGQFSKIKSGSVTQSNQIQANFFSILLTNEFFKLTKPKIGPILS